MHPDSSQDPIEDLYGADEEPTIRRPESRTSGTRPAVKAPVPEVVDFADEADTQVDAQKLLPEPGEELEPTGPTKVVPLDVQETLRGMSKVVSPEPDDTVTEPIKKDDRS
jgi:hypothetical protein